MGIELLLIVLGVTLFGGTMLAVYFSFQEKMRAQGHERPATVDVPAERVEVVHPRPAVVDLMSEELLVREIEHHLRKEMLAASSFVNAPSAKTLWADTDLSARAS